MAEIAVIFDIGKVLCFPSSFSAEDQWVDENLGSLRENRDTWAETKNKFARLYHEASLGMVTEDELGARVGAILRLNSETIADYMDALWADCVGVLNDELVYYFKDLRTRCRTGLLTGCLQSR